ncbi:GNAT family N-acetyltransferase [Reinekea marinisedimentorum]|uniref:Acetyltransferase (GNAT) family protein n=1 Tax=Reinekea marinisedimentorum TaxID=230495 RepID=A0A4R3IE87_9GAMM|nr:GNAT family N-acetyltransferase [Reinekea marinisedimentorum]TCS44106.1 acetyltransferase (GNAT) family protein [Reinekea marinisedimentorum]
MNNSSSVQVSEIETESDLKHWQSQWEMEFKNHSADISSSYSLLANYWKNSCKPEITLIIFHRLDRFVGACILSKNNRRFGPLSLVELELCNIYPTDGFFIESDVVDIISSLLKHAKKKYGFFLWLRTERASKTHAKLLISGLKSLGTASALSTTSSHTWRFDVGNGNFETYMSSLSRNSRQYLRKKTRQLERLSGDLSFQIVNPTSSTENLSLFNEYADLEDSGWKGRNNSSLLKLKSDYSLYKNIVKDTFQIGHIRWCKLVSANNTIAMLLLFKKGSTVWVYKTTYDEKLQSYSPGGLILTRLIEHYYSDKSVDAIDMVTNFSWVERWSPRAEPYSEIRLFPIAFWARVASKMISIWKKEWEKIV